jgi:hypothetical protein
MEHTPYLNQTAERFNMKSKAAPKSTVFGVLGKTKMDPYSITLGGLVINSTKVSAPKIAEPASREKKNTERHILGPASKTKIPGSHMGQVPYAGQYRSHVGPAL